jgi:hypothetical protein
LPGIETDQPTNLLDVTFDVVRRYSDFGSYGSVVKACKALQRRCPGFRSEQYEEAFLSTLQLFNTVIDILAVNESRVWQEYKDTNKIDFSAFDEEIQRRCPGMPLTIGYQSFIWVWFWHYLK